MDIADLIFLIDAENRRQVWGFVNLEVIWGFSKIAVFLKSHIDSLLKSEKLQRNIMLQFMVKGDFNEHTDIWNQEM